MFATDTVKLEDSNASRSVSVPRRRWRIFIFAFIIAVLDLPIHVTVANTCSSAFTLSLSSPQLAEIPAGETQRLGLNDWEISWVIELERLRAQRADWDEIVLPQARGLAQFVLIDSDRTRRLLDRIQTPWGLKWMLRRQLNQIREKAQKGLESGFNFQESIALLIRKRTVHWFIESLFGRHERVRASNSWLKNVLTDGLEWVALRRRALEFVQLSNVLGGIVFPTVSSSSKEQMVRLWIHRIYPIQFVFRRKGYDEADGMIGFTEHDLDHVIRLVAMNDPSFELVRDEQLQVDRIASNQSAVTALQRAILESESIHRKLLHVLDQNRVEGLLEHSVFRATRGQVFDFLFDEMHELSVLAASTERLDLHLSQRLHEWLDRETEKQAMSSSDPRKRAVEVNDSIPYVLEKWVSFGAYLPRTRAGLQKCLEIAALRRTQAH